ncbi:MAG: 50S ribosomal protein L11 methyltransferase [Pseudomonadota bacterium]
MSWLQISIDTSEAQAPLMERLFENLGALSVTLGDAGDQPLLEPKPGEERIWHTTRVTGLFEAERDADELRSAINQALNCDLTRSLQLQRLEDRAWERVWLEHFHPMKFGRRLWVCPDGQLPSETDAVIVQLDPGLAFGTGTHPTTALCLEWLDSLELAGKTLIDYGCGSGILAIAALQLGADKAIAVDYDPQALEATRYNAVRNGVADRLTTHLPVEIPDAPAELLVANILAGPLIELAPKLRELLKPQGRFALSGILVEQTGSVTSAYEHFARLDPARQLMEWMLITGNKR